MSEPISKYYAIAEPAVHDLKRKSIVGGVAVVAAQGLRFVLQTGTTMILARLLSPEDFGLQGMVVALTGFLGLFRDAGLGAATVQRSQVTEEQISSLFWINAVVGIALALMCAGLAPVIASFYHEPRLYWIATVSGLGFLFGGFAAQHQALLQRAMRFVTMAKLDVLGLAVSSAVGVIMALMGCRYWSLVGMALAGPITSAAGAWICVRWLPGPPRRKAGVRSMLHFGWKTTCNNLVVYFAWNSEKILLGRFWGADALGLYGRAFQLVTLPVQQLNNSVTGVAFPALSRIQNDAERLARAFLKGFSLLISLTIPITICCTLFADETVRLVLGPKWAGAAPLFRLLAPTAVVFALANPLSWLVISTGRAGRALSISVVTTPMVILGIALGLSHGPKGVAFAYSTTMVLLLLPIAAWSKHGTGITWLGLWNATKRPIGAGIAAGLAGLVMKLTLAGALPQVVCLFAGVALVLGVYGWVLLIVLGEKDLYLDLLKHVRQRATAKRDVATPVEEVAKVDCL